MRRDVLVTLASTPFSLFLFTLALLDSAVAIDADLNMTSMAWEERAVFPGGGRHHPIMFANATHGFLLTGSTTGATTTSDIWVYEAETDTWTDLSSTAAAFPGVARSFGYGVASSTNCSNSKAYLGFGASASGVRLADWWEFDMSSLAWRQLADFPGPGRRHPAMNWVEGPVNEIHVGLGDGVGGNYNDWWAYSIETDEWRQLENLPSVTRHHPFYFVIGTDSYAGLGHSNSAIERDFFRFDSINEAWIEEPEFASYSWLNNSIPVTTEARVAGTQFSVTGSCDSNLTLGFVLSGDGDDHGTIATGEFHVFDPAFGSWHPLPPHPGFSRWAPGSFVLQGTSRVYFLGGYDRTQQILFDDLWTVDIAPVLAAFTNTTNATFSRVNETQIMRSFDGKLGSEEIADMDSSASISGKGMSVASTFFGLCCMSLMQ
mmetsp:Transcript_28904/g.48105  ORF Transcript_28904/g.48105 Transcript_28904/m.48105 type:complete len:431 (-) Transcript_28904:670-1962(-)